MTKETEKKKVAKAPTKKVTTAKKTVTTAKKKVVKDDTVPKMDVKKDVKDNVEVATKTTSQVDSKETTTNEKPLNEYLPEGYYPRLSKYGMVGSGGCVIVSKRIIKFVEENQSDWYMKMEDLPFYTEVDYLYTLLYFIINDGFVNMHDVGSSVFYKLTIEDSGGESTEMER